MKRFTVAALIIDLQPRVKRWAGLHDFNYREPCPIFSAAPGGVSGQPGNNGSYAPEYGVIIYPCMYGWTCGSTIGGDLSLIMTFQ